MGGGWRNGYRLGLDGHWHYRFKRKGEIYEGSTGCKRFSDAKMWLEAYKSRLALADVGIKQAPVVKSALAHWVESRVGKVSEAHLKRAEQAWRLHILPHIGEYAADQVTTEVVDALIGRYLEGGRNAHGANTLLLYLKAVFGHLVKLGYLRSMPFDVRPLRAQQPVRAYVPLDKIKDFLDEIDRTGNLHVSVAVRAQLLMGLRESAALGMRWEWFSDGLATYTTGKAKGKKARPKPVPEELRVWLVKCRTLSPWVLPAEDGNPHRQQFTKKAILRAGKKIGVPGLTPHRLRGTYATLLSRQPGVTAFTIQDALDHVCVSTTQRYVQVGLDDVREAQRKLLDAAFSAHA